MTAANQIVRSAKKVLAMEGRPHMTIEAKLWISLLASSRYCVRSATVDSSAPLLSVSSCWAVCMSRIERRESKNDMSATATIKAFGFECVRGDRALRIPLRALVQPDRGEAEGDERDKADSQ
jgi:hypothetical protein